jgi:hypothetical protein
MGLSIVAPLALAASLGGAALAAPGADLVPAAAPVQLGAAFLVPPAGVALPVISVGRPNLVPAAAPVQLGAAFLVPPAAVDWPALEKREAYLVPTADPVRLGPAAMTVAALAGLSGGKEPDAILALTEGSAVGNVVSAGTVTSGGINVDPNAMNFTGIGNFVFNTGQNNVLQGVLNVYVAIIPSAATP